MGFFSKIFGKSDTTPKPPEHAFILTLKLSNDQFGTKDERERIHKFSDQLESAIESADAGEFDGDEFGEGVCTLYMYGPDADALLSAVDPLVKASPFAKGAKGVKRYGEASDPEAREETVEY